ncbi:hypothetical protein GLOIN_2v1776315 [Rhizophagus irregularis DAOM 181602=DAOM 197198]|uniref:Uncharacterized protein n=1 Tax=Rhizophagus irregularis (strain DAOM 181602 / DAOM 197198 / MUCL 43194) TaxID=747089 RepID=A0A2P4PXE3_RHIID|nr:hypothetical protein GLOIN_2v1776315 [Rhizophagus irregularis DAOM 181602=DAOM 197198]POG70069.1 hypothetical protein GLOIN_2v1776315 [Rhizophagus irregularis DAOM 181602=DAOM 197198]|eukprot:XP_025176935.1 hypothetical protein GLOIN_2v1776315 [Rhizophagus irregularis DAOM 181602=DAOM 197198]
MGQAKGHNNSASKLAYGTDLSDIKELDINYIELDPEYQVESDSNTIESDKDTDIKYGVATVYNITGLKNPRDCWKNIQYSLGGGGHSSIKNCPFFVPYSRHDNGEIKKISKEITLKGTRNGKNKRILVDSTNIKSESSQPKRKGQFASTRNSKQCKITENNTENIDFDIEEKKIALKERELQICVQEAAARKALAEAEAMELINLEKKKSLGLL